MRVLLKLAALAALLVGGTGILRAQPDTLFVSDKHVVHLVCPAEITDVEVSNEDLVYVRVMDNNPNIAGLMAYAPFQGETSLMVVDATRSVYVYYLSFRQEPGTLVRMAGAPAGGQGVSQQSSVAVEGKKAQEGVSSYAIPSAGSLVEDAEAFRRGLITHVGERSYGVSVLCDRLYVEGDRIFFRFKVTNRSSLSYSFGNVVFQVERPGGGGGRVKKTKLQEGKNPVAQEVHSVVEPGETVYSVFVFDKFSLRKSEEFQAFFNEEVDTGTRAFELVFTADDINRAVMKR